MEEKLLKKMEESITNILDSGLNTNNIDTLVKLTKIKHMTKEDMEMNYGNYEGYRGRGYGEYGEGSYGEYGERGYGARGRRRYRGDTEIDRIKDEYGRYQEGRQRYGANEETDKSYHYMIKALEDFLKVLEEEANTQEQKMQLKQVLQNAIR